VSPLDVVEVLDGKLGFALIALPVGNVSQTAQVHVLPTHGVRAQGNFGVRIEHLAAGAARLQVGDVALSIELLAEEEVLKVVDCLIGDDHLLQVGERFPRIFECLHKVLELLHIHNLNEPVAALLKQFVGPDELKFRVVGLPPLYSLAEKCLTWEMLGE
jgi:hypothetical protein